MELNNYACNYILKALLLVLIRNYLKYNLRDVLIECI